MTLPVDMSDQLWGGRLETTWFDPCGGSAVLVVSTQRDDEVHRFRVEADSVHEFRYETDGSSRPWFYAEVTQAHLDRMPDQLIRLTLLLWSEEHTITVRAASVRITEQANSGLL